MSDLLFGAVALMLVIEGLLPTINPGAWRQMFAKAAQLSDGQVRFLGLCSLLVGAALLAWWWR